MTFSKSILKKIATSETKKPDSPQITISNPLDDDTFINGIELILSPEFSKKGKLLIEINDIDEFDANDSESFGGYAKYPIPLSKQFRRGHDIRIFAWNGEDANEIKMSLNMSISKFPEPFNSQAVPLGKDVFNTVVSTGLEIFPVALYTNETLTQLIDLEGYRRFWALIPEQVYDAPEIIADDGYTNPTFAVNGDLLTFANIKTNSGNIADPEIVFDFGEILSLWHWKIHLRLQATNGNTPANCTFKVQYKEDILDSWSDAHNQVYNKNWSSGNSIADWEFDEIETVDARYVRVYYDKAVSTGSVEVEIDEVYNPAVFGGTASLSFEIKDLNDNWLEIIPASEFGTFTLGQSVAVQIGDTLTKKYALPSTQTDFRAKLIISGGSLNTGVSILRVQ